MDPDHTILITLFSSFDYSMIFSIIMLFVLLICSALISGAEVAFLALPPANLITENGKRSDTQKIIVKLLDKPKKLLATILVANNTVNIAIVLLFVLLTDEYFSSIN